MYNVKCNYIIFSIYQTFSLLLCCEIHDELMTYDMFSQSFWILNTRKNICCLCKCLGWSNEVSTCLSEIATSPPAPQRVWSRTHRRSWKRCGRLCTSSTLGGKGLVFSVPKTTGVELSQGRAYSGLNINDIEWSKCMESSVEATQFCGNLELLQFS